MSELYYSDYINTTNLQIQRVRIIDREGLNKDD